MITTLIISVLTSLTILFSAPVSAPVEAPSQAIEAPSQVAAVDAWQTLDDAGISVPEDSTHELMISHVATVDVYPVVGMGQFVLTSMDLPNTYHVFQYDYLTQA